MGKKKKSLEELEAELAAMEAELASLEAGDLPPPKAKGNAVKAKPVEAKPAAPSSAAAESGPDAAASPDAPKRGLKGLLSRKSKDAGGAASAGESYPAAKTPSDSPEATAIPAADEGAAGKPSLLKKLPFGKRKEAAAPADPPSETAPTARDSWSVAEESPPESADDEAPKSRLLAKLPFGKHKEESAPSEPEAADEPATSKPGLLNRLPFGKRKDADADASSHDDAHPSPDASEKSGLFAKLPFGRSKDAPPQEASPEPEDVPAPQPADAEAHEEAIDWDRGAQPAYDPAGPDSWDAPGSGAGSTFDPAPEEPADAASEGDVSGIPGGSAEVEVAAPEPDPSSQSESEPEPAPESEPEPELAPEPERAPEPIHEPPKPDSINLRDRWAMTGKVWKRNTRAAPPEPAAPALDDSLDPPMDAEPTPSTWDSPEEEPAPALAKLRSRMPSFARRDPEDTEPPAASASTFEPSSAPAVPVSGDPAFAAPGMGDPAPEEDPPEKEEKRRKRAAWLFPVGVVALAVLVLVTILPGLMSGDPADTAFGTKVDPPTEPEVTLRVSGRTLSSNVVSTADTVELFAPAKPGITYTWNFGDGTASQTGNSASHKYATPGSYTVTVTASNSAGEAKRTLALTVAKPLVAAADVASGGSAITASTFIFPGDTLRFTAAGSDGDGPLTYTWTFGDGSTLTGESVEHAYAAFGSYMPVLTVTDAHGKDARRTLPAIVVSYRETFTGSLAASSQEAQTANHTFPVLGVASRVSLVLTYEAGGVSSPIPIPDATGDRLNLGLFDAGENAVAQASGGENSATLEVTDVASHAPGVWQGVVTRPQGVNSAEKAYSLVVEVAYPARAG